MPDRSGRPEDSNKKLDGYRKILDAGANPALVAGWIAEVQGERLRADREIGLAQPSGDLAAPQVHEMVSRLTDITRILDTDDLGLKMQAYDDLGISVTYDPTRRVARIESRPKIAWTRVSVGGPTGNFGPRPFVMVSPWSELRRAA
jgi:hypothetical protein